MEIRTRTEPSVVVAAQKANFISHKEEEEEAEAAANKANNQVTVQFHPPYRRPSGTFHRPFSAHNHNGMPWQQGGRQRVGSRVVQELALPLLILVHIFFIIDNWIPFV